MSDKSIFNINIEAFKKKYQEAAYVLEQAMENGDAFWIEEPSDTGEVTAFVEDDDGGISFIEGMNDPRAVAEKKAAMCKKGWDVVVMGVGLGYVLEALVPRIDTIGKLIVIERRPEMLLRAFMHSDFSGLIESDKTDFVLGYETRFFKHGIDPAKTILIRNEALAARDKEFYTVAFASLKHDEMRVFPLLKEEQYNILIMCEDSLRKDRLSFYGADKELSPTPNIDSFFAESLVMDAVTMSTWTPSVIASMFSGVMPWEHGIVREILSRKGDYITARPNVPFKTIPKNILGMDRLNMLLSGNAWISKNFGFSRGFNMQLFTIGGLGYYGNEMNIQAKKMLEPLKNSKFFFFLHYMDTHQPFLFMEDNMVDISKIRSRHEADPRKDPLYKWDLAEEIQAYNSSVLAADIHIGDFLGALDLEGLVDNTIVVLFSDHGEELRDHNRIRYPRHGYSLYNELIQVPLLIHVPPGLREFVNGQLARFEGKRISLIHLIPLLNAMAERREFDPAWFGQFFYGYTGLQATKAFYMEENIKLICDLDSGNCELYDILADPHEKNALSDAADEAERMRRLLFELMPQDFAPMEEEIHVYDKQELADIQERLSQLGYM